MVPKSLARVQDGPRVVSGTGAPGFNTGKCSEPLRHGAAGILRYRRL